MAVTTLATPPSLADARHAAEAVAVGGRVACAAYRVVGTGRADAGERHRPGCHLRRSRLPDTVAAQGGTREPGQERGGVSRRSARHRLAGMGRPQRGGDNIVRESHRRRCGRATGRGAAGSELGEGDRIARHESTRGGRVTGECHNGADPPGRAPGTVRCRTSCLGGSRPGKLPPRPVRPHASRVQSGPTRHGGLPEGIDPPRRYGETTSYPPPGGFDRETVGRGAHCRSGDVRRHRADGRLTVAPTRNVSCGLPGDRAGTTRPSRLPQ